MPILADQAHATADFPGDNFDLEALHHVLRPVLKQALPADPRVSLSYLCGRKPVADDTTKLLVRNEAGQPVAVILVASKVEPDLVEKGMDNARVIKQMLGPQLGQVILDPKATGWLHGRSYTVLPYCKPLESGPFIRRWHNFTLRPLAIEWLTQVTQATAREPTAEELHKNFIAPLEKLAAMDGMAAEIKEAAKITLERIESSAWKPRHVLMHSDLWRGNILFSDPENRGVERFARLVIIDWPGAKTDGYGFYDLVRLSLSMNLPKIFLSVHIKNHCEILQCQPMDARSHLLAALAHLGQNLNHFPMENYCKLALTCFQFLNPYLPKE